MKFTFPIFFLLLLLTMPMAADAQSCTTAVCNAKSPSESDFQAALPSSSNTNATVVVNIPAGSGIVDFQPHLHDSFRRHQPDDSGSINPHMDGYSGNIQYGLFGEDKTFIQDSWSDTNHAISDVSLQMDASTLLRTNRADD